MNNGNIVEIKNNNVTKSKTLSKTIEIPFLTNSSRYKIDLYDYIGLEGEIGYVLRKRKDNKFICTLDINLNIVEEIKYPISANDLGIAMDMLKEYNIRNADIYTKYGLIDK